MIRNIEEDDIVAVNFNGAQFTLTHRAKVLSTPCATGDSWYFEDIATGIIYAVSEGCTITKLDKKKIQDEDDNPPF